MEGHDTSRSSQDSNSIVLAQSLWKFINNPVISIFSDLENDAAEQMLYSLLESMHKRSANLKNILVPPFNENAQNNDIQQQYSAFTTWLFGTMFYILGTPLSDEVHMSCIEMQACMLRILSTHHVLMFHKISCIYINILEEIMDLYENPEEDKELILSNFNTDRHIIENLDLVPYPVKIKSTNVLSIQASILKVIMRSALSIWDQQKLWNIVLRTVTQASPDVKLVALELSSHIIQFCIMDDHDNENLESLIAYSIEIMKTIPTWINWNSMSGGLLCRYAETFTKIIQLAPSSLNLTNLCFEIINFICHVSLSQKIDINVKQPLEKTTCKRIRQYLKENPRSCDPSDARKYMLYIKHCPEFIRVFIDFIFNDIKHARTTGNVVCAKDVSKAWTLLCRELIEMCRAEQFDQTLRVLETTRLLQSWLVIHKFQVKLYDSDIKIILKLLMQCLNSDVCQSADVIFTNLIHLLAHDESDKGIIQPVLLSPFSEDVKNSSITSYKVSQVAKSLEIETKIKCLEAICEFGQGKERLKILYNCISVDNNTQLAIAAVQNCILLMQNKETKFEDVIQYVLQPALSSKNEKIQEALANILGPLVCKLAGNCNIVRDSTDSIDWRLHCKSCNKEVDNEDKKSVYYYLPAKYEKLINPYFILLSSEFVCVRLSMSTNFCSFSNHIDAFNGNEMSKKWLSYIDDECPKVRLNVAKVIGQVLNNRIEALKKKHASLLDDVPVELDEFVDLIIGIMADTLNKVLRTANHSLHDTLLITAKNFACVPLHLTERRAVNIFLITILDPNSSPTAIAFASLAYQEIAKFLDISPKLLFIRYKKDFLKLMMQRVVCNYINCSYNTATSIHRIAKCIGYQGSRELLCKHGHHAVCFLLSFILEVPKTISLLTDFAELTGADEKQMLTEYFPHICSHAFLNMSLGMGVECLKLVSRITKTSLPELTQHYFTSIFGELMLHFHESPEKIIGFLDIISQYDYKRRTNFNTHERVVFYLKEQLHGILVNLDVNLGAKSDEYTQQTALASLSALMRYMGPEYLTPLRYKILAILRTSLEFKRPGFGPLICSAWDAYIHNVFIDDLGPLLPTICISIVPLLERYPQKVNDMLKFLIVEHNEEISHYISELFFIDDIKVSSDIETVVKAHILQARPEGFGANLKLWLARITHETDEVRVRALTYLKKFLADNRSDLNEMILSDTDVHPLIVHLLDTLLIGCQDKDQSIRVQYAECLGELGAIEPSLLPRRIISRDDNKFIPDTNEEFACAILYELVRALQMQKNTQNMDCISLAIQETLKAYDISPQGRNRQVWANLPSTMQQMIFPYLTSHYTITAINDEKNFPHPIYGSESGSTFETWAYNWLCSMSNSIHNDTLSKVLHACRPAFRRDMKTLIFCLPYVVSYVIAHSVDEMHNKLREEILTVINVREKPVLDSKLLKHRPLRTEINKKSSNTRVSDEARRTRCSQVVFSILDHLQRWLRERRLTRDKEYNAILGFCGKLDSLIVSEGCYQCREYHRALMYLEQHMAFTNKGLSEVVEGGLLAKIYAQLDEPDGVSGILATQNQSPTLQQLVLAHEVNGQLQDAATCYEKLAQKKVLKPSYLQGMIQCYLGLDQPFTAMNITEGVLSNRPELEPLMVEHEPFWRLAQFTRLDDNLHKNVKHSLLEDLKNGIRPDLAYLKTNLVSLLEDAARPGVYQQSYSYIMKLHILNEFDKAVSMMLTDTRDMPKLFEEWEKRGQLVRTSRGVEFVLSMRRATLDLASQLQIEKTGVENPTLKQEIGKIWLKSAKIARKAGFHQQAYMHILSASDSCPPQELHIEQAQLYWQKGCQEEAFTTLRRCFSNYFQPASFYKQLPSGECTEERKQCAKAKLLFAKYNDETLNVDTDGNIMNYKEAIEVWRAWEKSLLACAQYYESVVDRIADEEKDIKGRDLQVHMMNYYGKSLQYGCKYIHQSMPRMLTIWLDFASRATGRNNPYGQSELNKSRQDCLIKMTKIMEVYQDRLPTYMWLTAFSQLVSRICHPSLEVQKTLCTILVKLIFTYPQHCLWMMASVFNSSYSTRHRRCQEIFNNPQLKTLAMCKLIKDFNKLWEKLIELSNKPLQDGVSYTTVQQLSRNLPRLLTNPEFSSIMIPTSKFRQLHLPPKGISTDDHNPFTLDWISIAGIEDNVAVMVSLQKPRRITLKGSDGKSYLFMCKPKDDLRRDFRLMEFNDIVNKYLQKDPESRQRRLYIRTYSVVPLNEECGLIEWVPNLLGFRPILTSLYKERGIDMSARELRSLICALKDPLEKKRQVFLEKLLPRHPSVLGDWFRLTFPDPYGWYEARTAYIRTTAVMSMVGYILGLGDRHGENILFDTKCGDCVHVDFNCLFNRGEQFDWPERVPFRLTHNMVDAMGPLKIEGPFRRACQITMRVLRQQSRTLISVLTPFVYDPLVSWNKNTPSEAGEKTNGKAVEHIKNIEQRLKGLIRSQGKKLENIALHLSVEGQTNHLILEATNLDNLCQMYFGWGAYM